MNRILANVTFFHQPSAGVYQCNVSTGDGSSSGTAISLQNVAIERNSAFTQSFQVYNRP
jgi:hypothetical protein